jgi:hypothetical protein
MRSHETIWRGTVGGMEIRATWEDDPNDGEGVIIQRLNGHVWEPLKDHEFPAVVFAAFSALRAEKKMRRAAERSPTR